MKRFALLLAVAAFGFAPAAGRADDALNVGDPAPALTIDKWVKQGPVEKFEPGKLYVVEFWATWCGPCKTSIPHLTELAKKNKDVSFIGVSVWEEDPSGVEPFVAEMGDKMDYAVATDKVPTGGTGNDGAMAKAWMQAAGENGIPAAFVVSKDGRIAWIGHPMELDKPLEQIVSGEYDIEKAASERQAAKAREEKLGGLLEKLRATSGPEEAVNLLPDIDALMAEDAAFGKQLAGLRFSLLLAKDQDQAAQFAESLADGDFAEQPMMLNNLAWSLVDPDSGRTPTEAAKKAALAIALKGVAQTPDDGNLLDTLGRAYFVTGQLDKAIEVQEKAVKAAGEDGDPSIQTRLDEYKKAAADKK